MAAYTEGANPIVETSVVFLPKDSRNPDRLVLKWGMPLVNGKWVWNHDTMHIRLYCDPFPDFQTPSLRNLDLNSLQFHQKVNVSARLPGIFAGLGMSVEQGATRAAFATGNVTADPEGRFYGLHFNLRYTQTSRDNVIAYPNVEWEVLTPQWGQLSPKVIVQFGYIDRRKNFRVVYQTDETTPHRQAGLNPSTAPNIDMTPALADDSTLTRVFISYQRRSQPIAEEIRDYLEKFGQFEVWQDIQNIEGTDRWSQAIQEGLDWADRMILLMTPQSMQSQEVYNEWFYFYSKRKPLHCLMVEKCEPLYQLLPFQYRAWYSDTPRPWDKLIEDLRRDTSAPVPRLQETIVQKNVQRSQPHPTDQLFDTLEAALRYQGGGDVDAKFSPEYALADKVIFTDEEMNLIRTHAPSDLREYYLCRYVKWSGKGSPRLDPRFVRLTLKRNKGTDDEPKFDAEKVEFDNLRDIFDQIETHAIILLGDPGCGKSTVMKALERDIVVDALRNTGRESAQVPFYVRLSLYDSKKTPFEWLNEQWHSRFHKLQSLDQLCKQGRVVFILDGFNEIPQPHPDLALQWRQFIYDQIEAHHNYAIFSSRTRDYEGELHSHDYAVQPIQVEPFSPEMIKPFLETYAPSSAAAIQDLRDQDSRMTSLLCNPFALNLIAELLRDSKYLPKNKADTFTRFIWRVVRNEITENQNNLFLNTSLLSKIDVGLFKTYDSPKNPYQLPHNNTLFGTLLKIAYHMRSVNLQDFDLDEAVHYMHMTPTNEQDFMNFLAGAYDIQAIEHDFAHLQYRHHLIQEYFAARQLAYAPKPELVRIDRERMEPLDAVRSQNLKSGLPLPLLPTTGWEETTIMASLMQPDTNKAEAFIRGIMKENLPLAGECAGEADNKASDTLKAELRQSLTEAMRDPQRDLRERLAAGYSLGKVGSPEFEDHETYMLPPFVEIPADEYPIGIENAGAVDAETLKKQPEQSCDFHRVRVGAFRVAAFAVTNAEYSKFVDDKGYTTMDWWIGAYAQRWIRHEETYQASRDGWWETWRERKALFERGEMNEAYKDREGLSSDSLKERQRLAKMTEAEFAEELDSWYTWYTKGPITAPQFWEDGLYNNPLQPVVGVTWFEAVAYTQWLSAKTGRKFRLLTEVEREVCGRGMEIDRVYAYGPTYQPDYANTSETLIRRPAPVGLFAEGAPYGIYDLNGNVYEWTSTLALPYPYVNDAAHEDLSLEGRRIMRGGSFYHLNSRGTNMYRTANEPIYPNDNMGFRIAETL